MKPFFFKIELNPDESFTCREWHHPILVPWQFVSEYMLTSIVHGSGLINVGDSSGRFQSGDLFLIGPNMPRSFIGEKNSSRRKPCHLSSSFSEDFLGEKFFELPEMATIRQMLVLARRGIAFPSQVHKHVTADMLRLSRLKGWKRIWLLLDILGTLAAASPLRLLASEGFSPYLNERDGKRLTAVCKYVHESSGAQISRNEAARLASLSPSAFSHFFHKQMGKTFEIYVNDVRIGQICRKLLEQDSTVAEIAFETGFNNLSNFNRHFLALKGITPREYRRLHREE